MWRIGADVDHDHNLRVYRPRLNVFDDLSDIEFFNRYRFSKEVTAQLCDMLSPNLERDTHRSMSLSVELIVCTALRYYSQGGYLPIIGDLHGISDRSASRAIHIVSKQLTEQHEAFITWPTPANMQDTKTQFYNYCGFPKVVGAVDGCHIRTRAPSLPDIEKSFVNRKGWHSINCHIVCDFNLRIFDICPRFPGSSHDAFILNQSNTKQNFHTFNNAWLLGDSAYPQLRWLMTPFDNPTTLGQMRYNSAHKKGRSCIERCNGIFKSRFRCLSQSLNFSPSKNSNIIFACACLHNYAIRHDQPLPDGLLPDLDLDIQPRGHFNLPADEFNHREQLVNRIFSH